MQYLMASRRIITSYKELDRGKKEGFLCRLQGGYTAADGKVASVIGSIRD